MNLYIQIENGQPVNHPAYEENLLQAFNEIPNDWELFVRVLRPTTSVYEVLELNNPVYSKVDNVWTDVWSARAMTEEEKIAKQQAVKDGFNSREQAQNWSAWTLNETTCLMQPPIPRPEPDQTKLDAGVNTFWCGAENNWKDTPVRPEGKYEFNFFAWQWVQVMP